MALKLTKRELHDLGLVANPGDPTQLVMANELQAGDQPDETWTIDRLGLYAVQTLAEAGRLTSEATVLARRSAVQTYRAGHALSIAHRMLKAKGKWCKWLNDHNIARTTAHEAEGLYKRAGSEEAVVGLSPTQAKVKHGVTRRRASSPTSRSLATASAAEPPPPKEVLTLSGVLAVVAARLRLEVDQMAAGAGSIQPDEVVQVLAELDEISMAVQQIRRHLQGKETSDAAA